MVSQVPIHRQIDEKLYVLTSFPEYRWLVRILPHSTGLLGLNLNTSCNADSFWRARGTAGVQNGGDLISCGGDAAEVLLPLPVTFVGQR